MQGAQGMRQRGLRALLGEVRGDEGRESPDLPDQALQRLVRGAQVRPVDVLRRRHAVALEQRDARLARHLVEEPLEPGGQLQGALDRAAVRVVGDEAHAELEQGGLAERRVVLLGCAEGPSTSCQARSVSAAVSAAMAASWSESRRAA